MNEETQTNEVVETVVTQEPAELEATKVDEKKYTDAEVDEIVNKKYAKWKAVQEKVKEQLELLVSDETELQELLSK